MQDRDGVGQTFQVFRREFDNAEVYIRPQGGKSNSGVYWYGDTSAVDVPLATPMKLLTPDGSVGAPTSSVRLRAGEAVILLP
jgi:hypothetical protein